MTVDSRSRSAPPSEETPLLSSTAELLAEAQEHPDLDPEAVLHLHAVKQHDTVYNRFSGTKKAAILGIVSFCGLIPCACSLLPQCTGVADMQGLSLVFS
jgi:hypothetical protein